jgi:hypothetical protein
MRSELESFAYHTELQLHDVRVLNLAHLKHVSALKAQSRRKASRGFVFFSTDCPYRFLSFATGTIDKPSLNPSVLRIASVGILRRYGAEKDKYSLGLHTPGKEYFASHGQTMRFSALATALLAAVTSVFAAPVNNALDARGGPVYDVTTKVIVVTVYVVTETEYLYEVKCDYDKWKKTCDHKVRITFVPS